MTYSYDPRAIADGALNQARFELGDVDENAPALSDEEILAVLDAANSWAEAIRTLEMGISRRFAHEVDIAGDGMKMEYGQRAERWGALAGEKKSAAGKVMPRAGSAQKPMGCPDHGGYFYAGMLGNPRASRCGGGDG